jgi:predicted phage terminase large subunit-like protein
LSRTTNPQKSTPSQLHQPQLDVHIPELHAQQLEVFRSHARFKVVVCGRQFGKTSLGAAMVVSAALKGKNTQWVAPSYPIGELGWGIIEKLCRQIPGTRVEGRPNYRLVLPGGGSIQLRSADNPDSLRGATLDGVVFDEAAQAKPEAWPILRPTLSVKRGWAMFISTPKGLNWFHDLYADAAKRTGWERWRIPSSASPFMPPEDIELARAEMSSLMFSQEYEAEFISAGTGMFRADWIQHYQSRFQGDERYFQLGGEWVALDSCRKFHTIDLAWSLEEGADFTVISSWALTKMGHLILLDVLRDHYEGPEIIPKMRLVYERWGGVLFVEKTTHDKEIIKEAIRVGLPVKPVRAEKDKVSRALPATARMEQGRVWFPPASTPWFPEVEEELLAFPAGRHDDFVDTLAYAVAEGAKRKPYEDHGIEFI